MTLAMDVRDSQTALKYLNAAKEAQARGDRLKSIESLEAAFTADPDDLQVCFQLAYQLDLMGEEDEAIHLYEQVVHQEHPPLNALLNLAVLYEDRQQYAMAERCLRQILATQPNHERARLYIKDVMASREMVVEEEPGQAGIADPALLETPVTDFELSVRTRNALRKMSIRSLADLLRHTEAELRSFKNFGESSIDEIKSMLSQRNLRLGQHMEQAQAATKQAIYEQLSDQTGADSEMLSRGVGELSLSVRARKALALLNVQTLGDLCMKTEAELMGVKNFGMTSLLEIKEKLGEMGLTLRPLEA